MLGLAIGISHILLSQSTDSTKKTNPVIITGSVDGYYRYNFNNPKDYPYNSFTSFPAPAIPLN